MYLPRNLPLCEPHVATWSGASGRRYDFAVARPSTAWVDEPAVFILVKREGGADHALYVGTTENLHQELGASGSRTADPWRRAMMLGMTHVHVRFEACSAAGRRMESRDLAKSLRPVIEEPVPTPLSTVRSDDAAGQKSRGASAGSRLQENARTLVRYPARGQPAAAVTAARADAHAPEGAEVPQSVVRDVHSDDVVMAMLFRADPSRVAESDEPFAPPTFALAAAAPAARLERETVHAEASAAPDRIESCGRQQPVVPPVAVVPLHGDVAAEEDRGPAVPIGAAAEGARQHTALPDLHAAAPDPQVPVVPLIEPRALVRPRSIAAHATAIGRSAGALLRRVIAIAAGRLPTRSPAPPVYAAPVHAPPAEPQQPPADEAAPAPAGADPAPRPAADRCSTPLAKALPVQPVTQPYEGTRAPLPAHGTADASGGSGGAETGAGRAAVRSTDAPAASLPLRPGDAADPQSPLLVQGRESGLTVQGSPPDSRLAAAAMPEPAPLPTPAAKAHEARQDCLRQAQDQEGARRALGLDAGAPVVLFAGELSSACGADIALDAMLTVCGSDPAVQFLFAGEGPLRGACQERTQLAGFAGRCRFLGDVPAERFEEVLLAADFVLIPARARFGEDLACMALRARKPVLATHQAGIGCLVHGRNGLITYDNPGSFVWGIRELLGPLRQDILRRLTEAA